MAKIAKQIDFLLNGYKDPVTGALLNGGKVKTYLDGTSTLSALWTDRDKINMSINPAILDSAGRIELFGDGVYKFEIYTSGDVLIETINGADYRSATSLSNKKSSISYNSLNEAIADIAGEEVTLLIENSFPLTANATVPENITLEKTRAGIFTGAFTLTINGALIGDMMSQWFDSSVTVSGNPKVLVVRAEWFNDTEDSDKIQKACDLFSVDADVGGGSTVKLLPNKEYTLNSTVVIPPGVELTGTGLSNLTNLSGTVLHVNFDGVGLRMTRTNPTGSGLFYNGKISNLTIYGSLTATLAQRLIELGDHSNIDTHHGAWGGSIKGCIIHNSSGYGIYSAHSQSFLIKENTFNILNRAIFYPTSPAESHIIDNTFLSTTTFVSDFAVAYEPGALGGNTGFIFEGNYIGGFNYGLWAAGSHGIKIQNNTFEGTLKTATTLSSVTFDGTDLGGTESALPSAYMTGNDFINVSSGGNGNPCMVFNNFRFGKFDGNHVSSPNGFMNFLISLTSSGSGTSAGNTFVAPSVSNSNSVPTIDTTAGSVWNNNVYTNLLSSKMEVALAPGTTSASAIGVKSILNQNNSVTIFSSLTGGYAGQVITMHARNGNAITTITGVSVTITQFKSLTVQYSVILGGWKEVSRTF